MTEKVLKYLKLIPNKPKLDVSKVLKSPMPGLVKTVACAVGDLVIAVETLISVNLIFVSLQGNRRTRSLCNRSHENAEQFDCQYRW